MTKKNKWLYEFEVYQETVEKTKEESKNEKGETVTTEKETVVRKPIKFAVRRPNRKMYDEAELFYSVKLSDGIKQGLLTRALLEKRYENDGGVFTEDDKGRYTDIYKAIFEKENDLQRVALNLENENEDTKTQKMGEIYSDLSLLRKELQEYEIRYTSLFDQTAESRAKNHSVMWWTLFLSYYKEDEKGEYGDVFAGLNYDSKLDSYDTFEEEGELFWDEAIKKLLYFVSFWNSGQAESEEDFESAEQFYNASYGLEEEKEDVSEEEIEEMKEQDVVDETPVEEVKEEVVEEVVEEVEEKKPAPKKRRKRKTTKKEPESVSE